MTKLLAFTNPAISHLFCGASLLLLTLTACATETHVEGEHVTTINAKAMSLSEVTAAEPLAKKEPLAEKAEQPKYKQLPPNTLKTLLLAEIALDRNMPEAALKTYYNQAISTRDPNVIKRGLEMSSELSQHAMSLRLIALWQDIEPDNPESHVIMARQQLILGNVSGALSSIKRVLRLGGVFEFDLFNQVSAKIVSEEQKKALSELQQLTELYPENGQLWLSIAYLHSWLKQNDMALATAKKAMQLDKDDPRPLITHSQLQFNHGKQKKALKAMERGIKKFPDSHRLHLSYVESLLKIKKNRQATAHVESLRESFPHAYELLFQAAMLCAQFDQYPVAKLIFVDSIENGYRVEQSVLALSNIAEVENDLPLAINYLQNILPGNIFYQARARLAFFIKDEYGLEAAVASLKEARSLQAQSAQDFYILEASLLSEAKDYEGAYQTLTSALIDNPRSIDVLYARSLASERMNKIDLAEADLLTVITAEPKNSMALNALGYTLTNKTNRHEEALSYIEKAYQISPNDPAILDSMGWVYYKLGDYQTSLSYLRDAMALQPDHEIAAHLGEVLWMSGEQQEAEKVWQLALDKNNDSEILQAVIKRYLNE